MLDKITPGSRVDIKIVKQPTNAAAAKTLVRVLSKDEKVKAENKRLRIARDGHFEARTRSGRLWGVRVVKQRPVKGVVGESGTVTATVDVLNDLRSVQRFIEVSPA